MGFCSGPALWTEASRLSESVGNWRLDDINRGVEMGPRPWSHKRVLRDPTVREFEARVVASAQSDSALNRLGDASICRSRRMSFLEFCNET